MTGPQGEIAEPAPRILERLLKESVGMSSVMRRELFSQQGQMLDNYSETAPSVVVSSAEGNTVFRGLDPGGDSLAAINEAAESIGRAPQRQVEAYRRKVASADADGEPRSS